MNTRRLLPLALVGALMTLAIATPSSASAASLPVLGVADNNLTTVQDPKFRAFGIRHLRVTIPWNTYLRPNSASARRFSATIRAAQRRGVKVLASFTLGNFKSKRKRRSRDCPTRRACTKRSSLASIRAYTRMFKRFKRRHRTVREIIPWNEQNHRFMPTRTRRGIARSARYYRAAKRNCRRCTVLGATVLDEKNVVRWLRAYKRALRRLRIRQPRIWGLHAYKGVERRRPSSGPVRTVLRNVRGKVWIVESGGLFKHSGRRPQVRQNAARQARQHRFVFRIADNARLRRRIRRVYIYNWAQTSRNSWDSALIGPNYAANNRTPITDLLLRPSFFVFQAEAQKRRGFRGPAIPVPPGAVVPPR